MYQANTAHKGFLWSLIFLTLMLTSCTTENWTQFRGPENNMVLTGENLPTEWGEDQNVAWTFEVDGDSWSSPVIWDNKVFVASSVAEKVSPPAERVEEQPRPDPEMDKSYLDEVYRWEVTCVDLETGEELWSKVAHKGAPRDKKHRAHNYAGETPVTDGKRLYVYFGMTGLYCYDLEGELLWEKDLGAFKTLRDWGTGSSPLVYNNMVYVQVDNEEQSFLVALDARSGDELWRVKRDEATNYSTPTIWKNRIRTELVTGGKKARAYNPATGDLLWELHMAGHYNIPSGVADKDYLYIGNSGYRDVPSTLFCVQAGVDGDITPDEGDTISSGVVWSMPDASSGNPSPLLYEGLLYVLSSRGGEFTCIEPSTGSIIYQEKVDKVGGCWATPWVYNDKIFFYDEKGVTSVIKAGKEFELLYQNKLEDKFWASVAVKDESILIKGVDKLYCLRNAE
jgi:outer membrane protein assembly factor BamB